MLVPNKADAQDERREADQLLLRARGRREARGLGQLHLPGRGRQGRRWRRSTRSLVDNQLIFPDERDARRTTCDFMALDDDAEQSSTKESSPRSQVAEPTTPSAGRRTPALDGLRAAQRHQAVRRLHRRRRPRPDVPAGLVLRAARPVGLRQDHDAADGRRPRGADRRHDHARRPGHHPAKPYKRPVNTVFQSYALFPHLDIFENVAFGLRRRGVKDVDDAGRARCSSWSSSAQLRASASRPSSPAASSSGSRWPGR